MTTKSPRSLGGTPLLCPEQALTFLFVCLAVLVTRAEAVSQEPTFANVPYVSGGGERQQLDLYLPTNYREVEKLPVLVWIHGGSWQSGSKKGMPGKHFTEHGYACVSINYRLVQQAAFPAQIEDCKAAIRWLRANARTYHLDPNRIGVWGASAGGHLVALLGTTPHKKEFDVGENLDQSSAVQAVCDIFGPTDLIAFADFMPLIASKGGVLGRLLGGTVSEKRELAVLASPIFHITKECPPFLIVHGSKDWVVPIFQSERFYDALQKAGVESEMVIKEGVGHDEGIATPDMMDKVTGFFDKYVKKEPAK